MFEQDLGMTIIIFFVGLVVGMILTLLLNKIRSGSVSPAKVKREMEEYQDKVEEHFDQTSEKFKQMATQYQDLYKHLSVGATTLCRPENIAPGLVSDKDPLSNNLAIDKKPTTDDTSKAADTASEPKETDKKADIDSKIKADIDNLKTQQVKKADVNAKITDQQDTTASNK